MSKPLPPRWSSARRALSGHARRGATVSPWLTGLLARRPAKVAAIALANKMARIDLGASYERRRVHPEASHGAQHAA